MVKQVQESYHFDELMNLDQSIRINLINSLVGFRSVCLIGTINQKNISNLAIFNSIVHIGASPPLIGFVVRPDCVDRHTLSNILERIELSLSVIWAAQAADILSRPPLGSVPRDILLLVNSSCASYSSYLLIILSVSVKWGSYGSALKT